MPSSHNQHRRHSEGLESRSRHRAVVVHMPDDDDRSDNSCGSDDFDLEDDQLPKSQALHSAPPSSYKNTRNATARTAATSETPTISSGSTGDDYQERLKAYQTTMGRKDPTSRTNKNSTTKSGKKVAEHSYEQKSQQQQQQLQSSIYTEGTRAKTIVPLLAMQAYHLPGNTWCQDWRQYMTNNHPVFGICCHHPLHPIGACTRIVALIGSVIFGLALTNFFYLFFLWNPEYNQDVITVLFGDDQEYVLTTGMLLLWTVGGSIHAFYNLVMWHIAACVCCRTGGCCESVACCPSLGKRLIRVFLLISVAFAVLVVLLRVGISHQEQDPDEFVQKSATNTTMNTTDTSRGGSINIVLGDDEWNLEVGEAQEFNFLVGYLVEMVLALFIYYPLGGTILFSGILGCGCIPLLGGRPAEVAAEKKKLAKRGGLQMNSTAGMDDEEMPRNQGVELVFSPQAVREFDHDYR